MDIMVKLSIFCLFLFSTIYAEDSKNIVSRDEVIAQRGALGTKVTLSNVAKEERKAPPSKSSSDTSQTEQTDLKKIAIAEQASLKASQDADTCHVIHNGRYQPFDLTCQRSAAALDLKNIEYNKSVSDKSITDAKQSIESSQNKQDSSISAQRKVQKTSAMLTIRSKFMNALSRGIYHVASISSYLKSIRVTKERKKCSQELQKVKSSTCEYAGNIQSSLSLSQGALANTPVAALNKMQSSVENAKKCGYQGVEKACSKYIKKLSKNFAMCQKQKKTSFIQKILKTMGPILISNSVASATGDLFSRPSEDIFRGIGNNGYSTQGYIQVPFTRGSLSYALANAKQTAEPEYNSLRNLQQNHLRDLNFSISNDNSSLGTSRRGQDYLYNNQTSKKIKEISDTGTFSFHGVNKINKYSGRRGIENTFQDASQLSKNSAFYKGAVKDVVRLLSDFEQGVQDTPRSISAQKNFIRKIPKLAKLNTLLKKYNDNQNKDVTNKANDPGEKLISTVKERMAASNNSGGYLSFYKVEQPRPKIEHKNKKNQDSDRSPSSIPRSEMNKYSERFSLIGKKSLSVEIPNISIVGWNYDLMGDRGEADMGKSHFKNFGEISEIVQRKDVSIFLIISRRYQLSSSRFLETRGQDVIEKFNLPRDNN